MLGAQGQFLQGKRLGYMAMKLKNFLWLKRCPGHWFYLQFTRQQSRPSDPWGDWHRSWCSGPGPRGHVWPGEGPGVWAPMTPDGLAFIATGDLRRHGFLCLDPGDQSLVGSNTESTVAGPYYVSEPSQALLPRQHSLLLPSWTAMESGPDLSVHHPSSSVGHREMLSAHNGALVWFSPLCRRCPVLTWGGLYVDLSPVLQPFLGALCPFCDNVY